VLFFGKNESSIEIVRNLSVEILAIAMGGGKSGSLG
jgi:hypothetical protein